MKHGQVEVVRVSASERHQVCILSPVAKTANAFERLRGLLGRPQPKEGSGLWIEPCNSVHTFFMAYSLDIIYLDKAGLICEIRQDLRPWRGSVHWSAHSVVELNAGEAKRLGIEVGDMIKWIQNNE